MTQYDSERPGNYTGTFTDNLGYTGADYNEQKAAGVDNFDTRQTADLKVYAHRANQLSGDTPTFTYSGGPSKPANLTFFGRWVNDPLRLVVINFPFIVYGAYIDWVFKTYEHSAFSAITWPLLIIANVLWFLMLRWNRTRASHGHGKLTAYRNPSMPKTSPSCACYTDDEGRIVVTVREKIVRARRVWWAYYIAVPIWSLYVWNFYAPDHFKQYGFFTYDLLSWLIMFHLPYVIICLLNWRTTYIVIDKKAGVMTCGDISAPIFHRFFSKGEKDVAMIAGETRNSILTLAWDEEFEVGAKEVTGLVRGDDAEHAANLLNYLRKL